MSRKKIEYRGKNYTCSIELCLDLIGGKWKALVLFHLIRGAKRSGDLKRTLPGISDKMFTQTVRQLEDDGLLKREVFPVVPPKVEYSLSDKGKTLVPVLKKMCSWGEEFLEKDSH